MFSYGAEGDRTPDLLIANEALSQLSYSPTKDGKTTAQPPFGQPKNARYLSHSPRLAGCSGRAESRALA